MPPETARTTMKRNISLDSIITRDLETIQQGQPLSEVARLCRERDIHHIPVLDGRRPVGMIAHSDIMRLIYDADHADARAIDSLLDSQFDTRSVMRTDLTMLPLGASIREAAQTLLDHHQHSVIIVDQQGDIAGILTSSDLIRFLLTLI